MTDADLEVIAQGLAPVVKDYIARAVASECAGLIVRLTALEQRAVIHGRDGRDGLAGPPGPAGPGGRGLQGEKGLDGTPGRDGRDAIDGKDGANGLPGATGETGAPGPPGDRGEKGLQGLSGERGEKGLDGKDGTDGRDGREAIDGKDGAPGERGEKGLDGQDGRAGIDGKDGVTMDVNDLQAVDYDGERTVTLVFQRDGHVKTFPIRFALPVYKGIHDDGSTYEPTDLVTWNGAVWIAKAATDAKPGLNTEVSRAWKLIVKGGKDGKAGAIGPKGEDGKDGRPGRDLTNLGPDGSKWG